MKRDVSVFHSTLVERVAETFGQAYFIYDVTGKHFRYLNRAFYTLFGIPEATTPDVLQLLGQLHEEDKVFLFEKYAKLLDTKTQEAVEFRVNAPYQETKWVCLNCQLLEEGQGVLLSGFAEDITVHKEYQANLLKFNSKKNATLEILSHDLAAPFTNIEGMVELLEGELLQGSGPSAMNLVQFIKDNAKKGSDLIRDFIDNEFLESSQIVLHKERVNICQRLQIMIENYQQMGESLLAKNFELVLPGEPVYMYLDVMKMMQVFNNLISNAIKFTYDQGTISVALEDKGDSVLVAVTDDGIGIPDSLKPNLFDKFTSSRREGIKGEKSIGLGMSIIKKIVELHNGKVWFESTEDAGSTFYVEIPKE
ncbi:PAS domain-containing sensor histidine kinase [Rufibacter ruber]|uniref:PAS domain-containing sensor histidine kinase n=1 Tax=Rufibacter ruber TaxID=1783499 RepID=UPI00082DD641|nr:PAS domain-containing sensor histidine kinase [Rufibacter ruber]